MMRTPLAPVLAFAALASLAACASPDPRLYTLLPTNPAATPLTPPGPPLVVEVHRVGIPGYADRPEIVRSAADYRVHLAKNERWSEPFGDLLQHVLTDDLARRMPGAVVFSDAGSITSDPGKTVSIDIGRLESDGAGQVALEAQFAVHDADDKIAAVTSTVRLFAPIGGTDTASYAAAISTICGKLADAIVASGLALPAPASPPA